MAICTNDEVFSLLGISAPTAAQSSLLTLLRPMAEDAVRNEVGYSIEQATYTHLLPNHSDSLGELTGVDVLNDRVVFKHDGEVRELFTPERPLRSVTSVYEDRAAYGGQGSGDFPASALLTSGTDYYIDQVVSGISWSGKLVRISSGWSPRERTIKVTYVAGLTAAELSGSTVVRGPNGNGVTALKRAALVAAAIAWKEPQASIQGSNAGPITGERLADYSVQYAANQVVNLFGFKMLLPQQVKDMLADFKRRTV